MCSLSGVWNKFLDQNQSEQKVSCFIFEVCVSFLGFSGEVILLNLMDVLNTSVDSVAFN